MAEYLSPSIKMVMPQLEQACDDLIRQSLIRALTDYTKQLCEFDPELADILLEGTKTLPRCVRYVLEKAQAVAASQLEAMTEQEVSDLQQVTLRGRTAAMIGTAISDEQVFQWAQKYYYGGKDEEPSDTSTKVKSAKSKTTDTGKKKVQSGPQPGDSKEKSEEKAAPSKAAEDSQISLFSAA